MLAIMGHFLAKNSYCCNHSSPSHPCSDLQQVPDPSRLLAPRWGVGWLGAVWQLPKAWQGVLPSPTPTLHPGASQHKEGFPRQQPHNQHLAKVSTPSGITPITAHGRFCCCGMSSCLFPGSLGSGGWWVTIETAVKQHGSGNKVLQPCNTWAEPSRRTPVGWAPAGMPCVQS